MQLTQNELHFECEHVGEKQVLVTMVNNVVVT